ncbi:Dynactin, isoform [Venturia inaequalis]|nr:Dynactin, isoform [Venturia inaequalis]
MRRNLQTGPSKIVQRSTLKTSNFPGVHVDLLEDILQSVHVGVVKYVVSNGLDLIWPENGSVEVDENSIVVCIDGPCDEVFVVEDTEVLCVSEGGS